MSIWSSRSNQRRTLQSLLIRRRKRPPLGGLSRRKMLAFCCQKQFPSTLDNMRQCSNRAQWMAVDVTKPQVSKKNQQQTNLRAFWTRALTDNPLPVRATPRKPQIQSFATHLLGTFAASWHADSTSLWSQCPGLVTDLPDVKMREEAVFQRGSCWIINSMECIVSSTTKGKKKRTMQREVLFPIAGAFKIGANHYVKHDLNKWIWLLWLADIGKSDWNTLRSMTQCNSPKKGRKRREDIMSPVFFSEFFCYHTHSQITNLLLFSSRNC